MGAMKSAVSVNRRNSSISDVLWALCVVCFLVLLLFSLPTPVAGHGHSHDDGHGHSHGHAHSFDEQPSFKYSQKANADAASASSPSSKPLPVRDRSDLWLHALGSTFLVSLAPILILFAIPLDNSPGKRPFLKILLAFASGGLLGDAFLHLIPHALMGAHDHSHQQGHSHESHKEHGHSHSHNHGAEMNVGLWVLAGILIFLFIEKLIRLLKGGHSHSHSHATPEPVKDDKKKKSSVKKDDSKSESTETTTDSDDSAEQCTNRKKQIARAFAREEKLQQRQLENREESHEVGRQREYLKNAKTYTSPSDESGSTYSEIGFQKPCKEDSEAEYFSKSTSASDRIVEIFKRNSENRAKLLAANLAQQHPIDTFFKSTAMTVKKMSAENQIRIKLKICEIITHFELQELNPSSSSLESTTSVSGNTLPPPAQSCFDSLSTPETKIAGYLNLAADVTHNFTDGLAIGASFLAGKGVGLLTTLTILIHEVPHEIGDFAILIQSGCSRKKAMYLQLLTAVGAFSGTLVSLMADGYDAAATAWILPLTAGGFIYIATVSVLPDLLEDTSFFQSVKEIVALVIGVYMMVLIASLE